jgi:hypothetical protein
MAHITITRGNEIDVAITHKHPEEALGLSPAALGDEVLLPLLVHHLDEENHHVLVPKELYHVPVTHLRDE